MPNFSKFTIFICVIIILPVIVNIVDNIIKIFDVVKFKNSVLNNLSKFDDREFLDFVLEFVNRSYGYSFEKNENDVYLNDGGVSSFLYYNNDNCDNLNILDIRKLIAFFESKGVKDIFIFTTKILTSDAVEYLESIKNDYRIKYIHGEDLNLNYEEFIHKYYEIQKYA